MFIALTLTLSLRLVHFPMFYVVPMPSKIPNSRSQTSWIWLETKLVELGMIGAHHNYQVCSVSNCYSDLTKSLDIIWQGNHGCSFRHLLTNISSVLDKKCMFTVFTERDGKPWSHSVKALQIIWNHFPQLYVPSVIKLGKFANVHI